MPRKRAEADGKGTGTERREIGGGRYAALSCAMQDYPEWRKLPWNARLCWWALTHEAEGNVAGIFRYHPETVQGHTGLTPEAFPQGELVDRVGVIPAPSGGTLTAPYRQGIRTLEEQRWIVLEDGIVWLRNVLRFDPFRPLAQPQQVAAIIKVLEGLPRVPIVRKFIQYYKLDCRAIVSDVDRRYPNGAPCEHPAGSLRAGSLARATVSVSVTSTTNSNQTSARANEPGERTLDVPPAGGADAPPPADPPGVETPPPRLNAEPIEPTEPPQIPAGGHDLVPFVAPANPLVTGRRDAMIAEAYELIRWIAPREDLDPTEVLAKAINPDAATGAWTGPGRRRLDLHALSDNRLANTLIDLREWKRRIEVREAALAAPKAPPVEQRIVPQDEVDRRVEERRAAQLDAARRFREVIHGASAPEVERGPGARGGAGAPAGHEAASAGRSPPGEADRVERTSHAGAKPHAEVADVAGGDGRPPGAVEASGGGDRAAGRGAGGG